MPFTLEKTEEIEAHLANNPYLSEGGLPGVEDARIFLALNRVSPDVTKTPHFHHWFNFITSFSTDLLQHWVDKADGKKVEQKPAKKEEKKKGGQKKEEKKDEKKQEKKAETKPADDDDDDPFAESAPKAAPAAPVQKPDAKKKKDKPAAKSIVVFEVKVYDQETDLDALGKKILERKIDGLVWNNEPKKIDVAYGMQKLQMGCVIEDDKVLTDDIFEPIEEWEEVQSVDMTSMQKL